MGYLNLVLTIAGFVLSIYLFWRDHLENKTLEARLNKDKTDFDKAVEDIKKTLISHEACILELNALLEMAQIAIDATLIDYVRHLRENYHVNLNYNLVRSKAAPNKELTLRLAEQYNQEKAHKYKIEPLKEILVEDK